MAKERKKARKRIRYRVRMRIFGTPERPRVAVFRSLNHIYLQAVDDMEGRTLAAASSLDKELVKKLKGHGGNIRAAKEVGALMATRLKDKGLASIVFDRGGFVYHGRVKAVADALREGGIKF
jgi:large subunit ribosomal protein L18